MRVSGSYLDQDPIRSLSGSGFQWIKNGSKVDQKKQQGKQASKTTLTHCFTQQ